MSHHAKIGKTIGLMSQAAIRAVAIFAGVLLLAGQIAAVAHFHPFPGRDSVNTVTLVSVDNGACALCLLAFHSSAEPKATPAAATPALSARSPIVALAAVFHRIDSTSALSRAPPFAD